MPAGVAGGLLAGRRVALLSGHRRGELRRRVLTVRRPQPLLLLGPREVLGHQCREVEVRLPGLGPHHVEIDLGAGRQVLVERHHDDSAAARLEVLDDVVHLDHLAGLADPRDDGERPLHQIGVAVRREPVQGRRGAGRAVDRGRGDDDQLVGEVQHSAHRAVEEPGARVGEDDRVLLAEHVDRAPVVLVVEGGGDRRVHVVGDDLQTGGRLRGEPADVHVRVEVRDRLDQVADGRPGLAPHPAAQRAGVRVGVDGEDLVLPLGGQRRTQRGGRGRLAHASLETDDGDPVAGQHRGADQLQLAQPLGLLLLPAQLEPGGGGGVAAAPGLLLAAHEPVGGELDGRRVPERGAGHRPRALVVRDGGGPRAARTRVRGLLGLTLRLGLLSVRLRLLRGDGGGEVRGTALRREGRVRGVGRLTGQGLLRGHGLTLIGPARVAMGGLARVALDGMARLVLARLGEAVAALLREAVAPRALGRLGRQRCAGAGLSRERLLVVRRLRPVGRLRRLGRLREAVAAGGLVGRGRARPLRRRLRGGGRRGGRLEGGRQRRKRAALRGRRPRHRCGGGLRGVLRSVLRSRVLGARVLRLRGGSGAGRAVATRGVVVARAGGRTVALGVRRARVRTGISARVRTGVVRGVRGRRGGRLGGRVLGARTGSGGTGFPVAPVPGPGRVLGAGTGDGGRPGTGGRVRARGRPGSGVPGRTRGGTLVGGVRRLALRDLPLERGGREPHRRAALHIATAERAGVRASGGRCRGRPRSRRSFRGSRSRGRRRPVGRRGGPRRHGAGGRRGRRRCGRPGGVESAGRRRQFGRGQRRPDRRRGRQMRARPTGRVPRRVLRVPGRRGVVDGELTRHLGGIRVGRLVDGQVPSAADLVPIAVHFASWCGRAPLCRGGWGRPFRMCRFARLSPLRRAAPARRFPPPRPTHPNRHPANSGRAWCTARPTPPPTVTPR